MPVYLCIIDSDHIVSGIKTEPGHFKRPAEPMYVRFSERVLQLAVTPYLA